MTQFTLSPNTQDLIKYALDPANGPGYHNNNYVAAYNAIYADLVANGGINAATVAWFQQAGFVDQQQWVPTAQGTFIWAYTKAAAATEGATITDPELQAASNQIALTVFQSLQSNNFIFDDTSSRYGFSTRNIVADDAGAGIKVLQQYAPGANLDFAVWGGSLFARTELQDPTYFSDYNITLQPDTRDSRAIVTGLAAGSAAVLASFSASIISTGFTQGLGNLDFDTINSVLSDQEKTLLTWGVTTGAPLVINPSSLSFGVGVGIGAYIVDSVRNTVITFFSGSSGAQALLKEPATQQPTSTQSDVVPIVFVNSSLPDPYLDLNLVEASDGSIQLLEVSGTVADQSIIDYASGGLTGDTINISQDGNGTLDIVTDIGPGDTSVVAADESVSGVAQDFVFSGLSETLKLDIPISFTGTISSFVAGDTIDLAGISATGLNLNTGNVLNVQQTGGPALSLQLSPSQDYSNARFVALPDGQGGTDVIIAGPTLDIPIKGTVVIGGGAGGGGTGGNPITITGGGGSTIIVTDPNFSGVLSGSGNVVLELKEYWRGIGIDDHDTLGLLHSHENPDGSFVDQGTIAVPGIAAIDGANYVFDSSFSLGPGSYLYYFSQPNGYDGNANNYYNEFDTNFLIGLPLAVACYATGTEISTPYGDVPIQDLRIGDTVRTYFTGDVAIKWIGHRRIHCTPHPEPRKVWPVLVVAGAFGKGLPCRDLWLSPDHAVFMEGVLIPIKHLVNGCTITQEPRDAVTYYHIELEQHDVLFAESLPAESYLDTGDRASFDNSDGVIRLFPDFSTGRADTAGEWEIKACAPLIVTGPVLASVRARLLQRAAKLADRPRPKAKATRAA